MSNIFNLIANENMKIYKKVSTYVMFGIILLVVVFGGIFTKYNENKSSDGDWKTTLSEQTAQLKKSLEDPQASVIKSAKDQMEKQIKVNEYSIKNNIPPVKESSLWGFVISAAGTIPFISLFVIIIGAGIIASEFSSGTVKLLLIRPYQRWKLLLSKYVTVLLTALFMLVVLFLFSFLLGGILFGFKEVAHSYLAYINGEVLEKNMVLHTISSYLLACVDLLMMVTFAFMISSVFRNGSLAIGLAIFLMFTGSTIVAALGKFSWVKYILFANTRLSQYIDGTVPVEGMTMTFSLIVLAIYFVVFNSISFLAFSRRDIA